MRLKYHYSLVRPVIVILVILSLIVFYKLTLNTTVYNKHIKYKTTPLERDFILNIPSKNNITNDFHLNVHSYTKRNQVKMFKPGDRDPRLVSRQVNLRTPHGKVTIFVYPAHVDKMISSYVADYSTWEEDLLNQTARLMRRFPGSAFIDVGCNVGVYTLFMASLGVDVVAIDPVRANLDLLSQSVDADNFTGRVTLIHNAVSHVYRSIVMEIPENNVGGAHFADDITTDKHSNDTTQNSAETVLLDDIIPFVKNRQVIIKMDIEGHEQNVLEGAKTFFQTIDTRVILMEWVHHRYRAEGQTIINTMVGHGFLPFADDNLNTVIEPGRYHRWPENVFWIKR